MTSPTQPNPEPLRLLFVKLKHIGDALILTPTLVAARAQYPNAEIWVVVRKGTEGILGGCPAIDHLLTVAPNENDRRGPGSLWRDLRTLLRLRRQRFDYAFELTDGDRGRWLAGLSRARHRCTNANQRNLNGWWRRRFNALSNTALSKRHRVEKDFLTVADCLPLPTEIPPLCFEEGKTTEPESIRALHDFAVIHPGSRWIKKRWPMEHWIELGHNLLKQTKVIVISSGPATDERQLAAELVAEWGSQRAITSDGQWTWAELAACLYRAQVFVGVDTAATHLAAACQCPIVGLYAYTLMHQWKPWRAHDRLFHPGQWMDSQEEILRHPAGEIMRAHKPDKVFAAAREMMHAPNPD